MTSYAIRADVAKNRLYLSLTGFMNDGQIKTAADLLISEVKKLKPGFSVINDISTFKPASQKGAEEIQRAQLYVKENGVGRIVRVLGPEAIAAMQFTRLTKTTGYKVDEVATIEEAEKLLEGK